MLKDVADMNGYLKSYGSALAESIKGYAEPLFSPGDRWDEKLYSLLRKPYQAQGDAVMGLCSLLHEYDSAIVVGEMGCGKTLIGASVPYVYKNGDRPARTLVMCPGHLVKKWQREILETVPDSDAKIIRSLEDVKCLDTSVEPSRPEYTVISKDRAKLGYAWRPAAIKKKDGYHCPDCNDLIVNRDGIPVSYNYLRTNKRSCGDCGSALWQADSERVRRFPLSEYVKRYMNGYFDFLVADEVHELKGGSTAQGNSFGALSSACGKTIAMTGTLLGGYADDVFYVLYRLSPATLKDDGLDYGHVTGWMAKYGVLERVTRTYPQDNVCSKGRKGRTILKRKPGVSPLVFSRHLLDKSVFLSLGDMASDLPPISEQVHGIDMDEELADAYGILEDRLSEAVRQALSKGSKALLGTYVNALLSYPDRPFDNEPIIHPHTGKVIVEPLELPRDKVYSKERKLVDIVKSSLSDGRKVFAFAQYTGTKDVTTRLQELLLDEGIEAEILRASVDPEKREDWIRKKTDSGTDVVIANPKLVQTGLDLYDFPELTFYQTGYSVFTLRQASRRSWRIGQKRPVTVNYLYYRPTMQERAMHLMGSKLEASLAIEGKFSEEGLLAMTQGEDMTTAMAKALVDGLSTEGVEQMWSNLNEKNAPGYVAEVAPEGMLFYVDPESFVKKRRGGRRRRNSSSGDRQMLLFDQL
ncbi:MAG: DEAD/DEAH box helicase [Candidatus Aenigmarchaeota archaeon]|nr:DEAD/DEAH box helicase [Candidatus Aenigmarchaeota archaeon]